ncbi:glycosyltransferase [Modestobacter sp. L9-4]|uniref:glycosyltransferase n=1 Tax=Modestobacter sp. L9-4 TaxID=2851567 RepID=UPI001C76FE6B|nr:glycosyltransferase [Modestobacter sp. L9-4]QXG76004.1 glycosyltransferase [Modestobacter sp. L9-4]
MSRRISLVADSDAWGGAEVYLTHLLQNAADSGWTASLVVAEPVADGFARRLPGIPTTVVPLVRHRSDAPEVRAALAAQQPDAVLVNLVDPGSNAAAVTAALATAPTAGVLHLPGDTGTGAQRSALADLYGRLGLVLGTCEDAREQVVTELGVARERTGVVPNGVHLPAVATGPAGHTPPRIGAFGRLTAQKGFDLLLGAVRRLVAEDRELDVVIGGHGRDADRLRELAAGLPVRFTGFVDDAPAFLADVDLFALSSRREALPLVLLEAMAAGLPCVTTAVGDVVGAVGEDAVVVPVGDEVAMAAALGALLDDADRRADLGARARERAVREMGAPLMARRTFALLDRLVG